MVGESETCVSEEDQTRLTLVYPVKRRYNSFFITITIQNSCEKFSGFFLIFFALHFHAEGYF